MIAVVLNSAPSADKSAVDSFTYRTDYPKPTLPSEDRCLVRVKVAGLNRAELRGRTGFPPGKGEFGIFQKEYHEDPPTVLGEELVGVIEEAGSSTGFRKGEVVTAFIYGGGKLMMELMPSTIFATRGDCIVFRSGMLMMSRKESDGMYLA